MRTRLRALLPLATWMAACTLASHAQNRAPWETFSQASNADSWSVYNNSDDQYYFAEWDDVTEPENPSIYFNFLDGQGIHFSTFGASNHAFGGNLSAMRSGGVGFDLSVADPANIDFVDIAFWSVSQSNWFYSPPITPADAQWNWNSFSFFEDIWYTFDDGWTAVLLDDVILAEVDEFIIRVIPNSAAAQGDWVAIDNFVLYPELIVPDLDVSSTGNTFEFSFEPWDGQAYWAQKSTTGLANEDFADVPGALVESAGLLSVSETMSSTAFWRIDTEIEYTPVPEVPAP